MAANNNNLFTFSFKLILILGVIGALIWFFLIPYAPDVGKDRRYAYTLNTFSKEENAGKYDIGFFGNSYSFTAYDPTIIKNRLGLNAIHLNSGSQLIETSLIVAREALKRNKLKYVFFEVSGGSLRKPPKGNKDYWYYQTIALQEVPLSVNKLVHVKDYFPVSDFPEYYISSLSREAGRVLRLNDINNYSSHGENESFKMASEKVYFSYNGFIANNQTAVKDAEFQTEFYRDAYVSKEKEILWTDDIIDMTKEFIRFAKEQGAEVVFFQSLKIYKTVYDDSAIQEIIKEFDNVKFLNLNTDRDQYSLDAKSFYNSTHLNYRGSYQVTNRLVDSISKWYEIPMREDKVLDFKLFKMTDYFYNLESSQDKFIKLRFDSIPEILKDYKLVIGVYPTDIKLLSDDAKKRNRKSDDFVVDPEKDAIKVGTEKVIVKKLETKVSQKTLDKIKIYFYKKNDTLRLPSNDINKMK